MSDKEVSGVERDTSLMCNLTVPAVLRQFIKDNRGLIGIRAHMCGIKPGRRLAVQERVRKYAQSRKSNYRIASSRLILASNSVSPSALMLLYGPFGIELH